MSTTPDVQKLERTLATLRAERAQHLATIKKLEREASRVRTHTRVGRDDLQAVSKLTLDDYLRLTTWHLEHVNDDDALAHWSREHRLALKQEADTGLAHTVEHYRWMLDNARVWTPRQKDALDALRDRSLPEVSLYGAQRTGKTDVAQAWLIEQILMYASQRHGLVVQSLPSLNRTIEGLRFFAALAGMSIKREETTLRVGDSVVQYVVANTIMSGAKIKGDTLHSVLFEEAPDIPDEALQIILGRISEDDAQICYTGNAGRIGRAFARRVNDPLKKGTSDRPGVFIRFDLTKRAHRPPTVGKRYVKRTADAYKGTPLYKPLIEGVDDMLGALFPHVLRACDKNIDIDRNWRRVFVTVDPGWTSSATHALLAGSYLEGRVERWAILDEWYHRGANSSPMEYADQVDSIMSRFQALLPARRMGVLVDMSDSQWHMAIDEWIKRTDQYVSRYVAPKGEIDEGMRAVQAMLGSTLFLRREAGPHDNTLSHLYRQMRDMQQDDAESKKSGADKRLKTPDADGGNWDGVDALRYLCLGISTNSIEKHRDWQERSN